jgi:spore maturation protein CgeB
MKIIYSFNKKGWEADLWIDTFKNSSTEEVNFIPFNHQEYLDPNLYQSAQKLDNLFYIKDYRLMRMYADLLSLIAQTKAEAIIVDNCFPYHPEFLLKLDIHKVIRTTDGPIVAYERDFAYLHAYDQVLYHSPAYSSEINMHDKLRYCLGNNKPINFLPLGVFPKFYETHKNESNIMESKRDIDVIFIGALHLNKIEKLAKIKKILGARFKLYGLTTIKKNLYMNIRHGCAGWIQPVPFEKYASLYQRSKIGINLHNRDGYTVGNYRLFDLPANGVMQISDGGDDLNKFFTDGKEIVGYNNLDELIEKIYYFLEREDERREIALNGYNRVLSDYKINDIMKKSYEFISKAISLK